MFYAQVKLLFDVADGRYWLVYRGFHALLLTLTLLLFTRALRVETWTDFAAAAFALTVLTGLHTFRGVVREAFPVSHFLEVVLFCVLALNLAQSRNRWWIDAAAAIAFGVASLTLESGLLVWVVLVSGRLCGMRGVSRQGIAAVTLLLGGYLWLRFGYYATGTPGIDERSTGLWFAILERDDLIQRFGADPTWLYVYNAIASVLSVLFSEPDGGMFEITRAWHNGAMLPRMYLAITSSFLATMLIAWAAVTRLACRGGPMTAGDRLMCVAGAVIVANAVLSYGYAKHEIMSVAGVFYAIAAFAAMQYAVERFPAIRPGAASFAAVTFLVVMSSAWTVRGAGIYHMQRVQAFKVRMDWAYFHDPSGSDPRAQLSLEHRLRNDALNMRTPNPYLRPRWMDRWWGE